MVKERKHKEWQGKNKKSYQTSKDNSTVSLIVGLFLISALIAFKNNPQLIYTILPKDSYFSPGILEHKFSEKILSSDNNNENNQSVIAGAAEEFRTTNFTKIDKYASSVRYDGTSIFELASLLSHYARTEAEKARIIYSWIAYNITYDVPAYLSGNYGDLSPQGVLKSRRGVCSGYANLYKALARAMGLDVVVVDGYAKGYGYAIGNATQINHAWNVVKINKKWYLLDSTWGAGSINNGQFNRQFNPYYFATPPRQLILDHFPAENKWQLLVKHYTKQKFDTIPKVSPEFFKDGLHLVSHHNQTIQANGRFQVVLSSPEDTIAISRLKFGSNLNDAYTFVQKKDNKIIVNVAPPVGDSELEIFSKNKRVSGPYQQAISYRVVSHNAGEEFPVIYSTFSENNSYLYAPLNKYLPTYQSVYFKVEVPNALEVQVIGASSNKWIKLTRSGSMFEGNVPVGSDKIKVSAKFLGNTDYWTLVEYN